MSSTFAGFVVGENTPIGGDAVNTLYKILNSPWLTAVAALPSSLRQLVEFSRTGFRTCAVFLMQGRDIQSVCRLRDFNKAQLIPPYQAYCDTGNVNSAGRLNLVIESVRPDTKRLRDSIDPAHADGAGGSPTD